MLGLLGEQLEQAEVAHDLLLRALPLHLDDDTVTALERRDRKSTRLNSSHTEISPLSLHDALPISFSANSSSRPRSRMISSSAPCRCTLTTTRSPPSSV